MHLKITVVVSEDDSYRATRLAEAEVEATLPLDTADPEDPALLGVGGWLDKLYRAAHVAVLRDMRRRDDDAEQGRELIELEGGGHAAIDTEPYETAG